MTESWLTQFHAGKKYSSVGAFEQLINYGLYIGDTDLAIVACRLYKDALAPSSKSSYSTGIKHLLNFTQKYDKVPFPIDNFNPASRLSLSLIFFAVYLLEMDSIGSYNTIRNYMSQVRQSYLKRVYPEKLLESQLLKTVKKGIKRCMPKKRTLVSPFSSSTIPSPENIFCTYNPTRSKAVAAIVLGFFAMLRFHSYGKLQLQSLTIVLKGRREIVPSV